MIDPSALKIVEDWLWDDPNGFIIPSTEWGQELYEALQIMTTELLRRNNE